MQPLLAIEGWLNERKIHNRFTLGGAIESNAAHCSAHGGQELEVKDPSGSGVAHINAAINHEAGTSGANSNLYNERSEHFIPLAVGNLDDAN